MALYLEGGMPVYERPEPAGTRTETFEDFYAREFAAVVGLAYALSGSRNGAEDLAQEAFFAAHRSWAACAPMRTPAAGCAASSRTCRSRRFGVGSPRRRRSPAWPLAPRVLPQLSEDDAQFWKTVRTLPRRQRQVITLHYLDDMPVAEIAHVLGTAEGTVNKHLHDGRLTLARRLGLKKRSP